MKKTITVLISAILSAVLLTLSAAGCGGEKSKESDEGSKPAASQGESITEEASEEELSDNKSSSESSDSQASVESELSEEESGSVGYVFEDDLSEKDYHHPEHFTEDEEFNAVFEQNQIDKEYQLGAMDCDNLTDMRRLAQEYGEKWKAQSQKAYEALYELLSELPNEREKLFESQINWQDSVDGVEAEFRSENENAGTSGLLAVDTLMLNFYKYRAAFLYHQIYKLTGSFSPEY